MAISSPINAQSIVENRLLLAQSERNSSPSSSNADSQGCVHYQQMAGSLGNLAKVCYAPKFKGIRIDSCLGLYSTGKCDSSASRKAFCQLQEDGYTENIAMQYENGVSPTISILDGRIFQCNNCHAFKSISCYKPNSVANKKPKKDRSDDRSPNWCTLASDRIPIGDGRARKFVDLSSACRQHDLCFWTIGSVKTQCDNQFLKNLKDICAQTIKSSLREQCNLNANLYYKAVSDSGPVERLTGRPSKGFNAAQNEAKEVASRLQKKFPNLDISNHHNDIAWELANRQARGEKVAESINNATNAISNKISNKQ